MKINIVIPTTQLSGGIRVIFLYANYLCLNGHDVICYIPFKLYDTKGIKYVKKMVYWFILLFKRNNWFEPRFKIKVIYRTNDSSIRDADIIIATLWSTSYDVLKLDDAKGKKVYFIQGYEIWIGDKSQVDESYKLPMNRIVVSKELHKLLKSRFNAESTVIYNGLDKREYLTGNKVINEKKTIIMLYSRSQHKGSKEGIKLLKSLQEDYKLRIILFGVEKVKDIPEDFEYYENPSREKLISLYREADIYLFTSKQESWGLPVMEAMANKCAVVGNNIGCVKELCSDKINALVIENLDYEDMKKKVESLIKDDKKLRDIQEAGYRLVQDYHWDNSFEIFEKYLEKCVVSGEE